MKKIIKNIFISHYSKDDKHIQGLKNLLNQKGYQLRNSSIDSTKPNNANNVEYIKKMLRGRIQWSNTCVVLIGSKTHTRKWVNWEIEQAFRKQTRIVGVYLNGASGSDVPENFEKYGSALVGWNSSSIIDTIEGENIWCNPDNTPRTTGRFIPTHGVC